MKDTIAIRIKNWAENLKKPNCPDEYEAKLFLNFFNINIPQSIRITYGSDINEITAYHISKLSQPFAVKVCSPDILHKTEENGVILNIKKSDLKRTLNTIIQKFPGKDILVEEQVIFTGPEFIIGAINDPDYGVSIMAGAGGIMTEIYNDAGFRLAPCSIKEAKRLLDELKIAPVLHNFRGIMLDRDKLAEAISATGRAALSIKDQFSHIDINPIVFSNGKWIALDANIILTQ